MGRLRTRGGAAVGAGAAARAQETGNPPSSAAASQANAAKVRMDTQDSIRQSVSRRFIADALSSQFFEAFAALVTCTYAVVIGIHSELTVKENLAAYDQGARDGASAADPHPVFQVLSYIFAGYYLLESTLKIFAFRRHFFQSRDWKWNVFDLLLVMAALYEIVTDLLSETADDGEKQSGGGEMLLLVLRLLKLVKLLRLVRLMRFFHELRTMLLCIVGSLRTLFWTLLMLGLILYIFGIVFVQGVTSSLATGASVENLLLIEAHWGSVGGAMITLFEAITGGNDWATLAEPLREAGFFYYLLFLFYILFLTIAVLNVLTGIFVDAAMAIGSAGKHEVSLAEHLKEGGVLQAVVELLDARKIADQALEWADWGNLCAEPVIQEFFAHCDLDMAHAEHFFRQMGGVNQKVLSADFVQACTQMKGGAAKSLDVCVLMHETKKLGMRLDALSTDVQQPLAELLARSGGSIGSPCSVLSSEFAPLSISERVATASRHPNPQVSSAAATSAVPATPRGAEEPGGQQQQQQQQQQPPGGEAGLRHLLLSLPARVASEAAAEMRRATVQTLIDAAAELEMPGEALLARELNRLVPRLLSAQAGDVDGARCESGGALGPEEHPADFPTGAPPPLGASKRTSDTRQQGPEARGGAQFSGAVPDGQQEGPASRSDARAVIESELSTESCDPNLHFVI